MQYWQPSCAGDIAGDLWNFSEPLRWGNTTGSLLSFSFWLNFGPTLTQSPSLNLDADPSGQGTNWISVGPGTFNNRYVLAVVFRNGAGHAYADLGSTSGAAPWAIHRWMHFGMSAREGSNFSFYLNGVQHNATVYSSGLPLGAVSLYGAKWTGAVAGSKAIQGGVAEIRVWSAQNTSLNASHFLYLAQHPPPVLAGIAAFMDGVPDTLTFCTVLIAESSTTYSPPEVTVYAPFDLTALLGTNDSSVANVTFTLWPAPGLLVSPSVLVLDASNGWKGAFIVLTDWVLGLHFELNFTSSLPALVGAPANRTIYLGGSSAIEQQGAYFASSFSPAAQGWNCLLYTSPSPRD